MVTPDQSPGSPTHHDREDVKRWRRRTFNSGTHQILAPTPLQSALGNSPAAANIWKRLFSSRFSSLLAFWCHLSSPVSSGRRQTKSKHGDWCKHRAAAHSCQTTRLISPFLPAPRRHCSSSQLRKDKKGEQIRSFEQTGHAVMAANFDRIKIKACRQPTCPETKSNFPRRWMRKGWREDTQRRGCHGGTDYRLKWGRVGDGHSSGDGGDGGEERGSSNWFNRLNTNKLFYPHHPPRHSPATIKRWLLWRVAVVVVVGQTLNFNTATSYLVGSHLESNGCHETANR